MAWIKRNLYFVVGTFLAVALMGLAGWYLYSKWQLNNESLNKLNEAYNQMDQLNKQSPHPGSASVDNIQDAKKQQEQVRAFTKQTHKFFLRIPPIPAPQDTNRITDQKFSTSLSRTLDQMQRDATNASVALPPQYAFSFQAQKQKLTFAPGSLEPLSVQLGEIKALCDVLIQAKVNSLDNLRRERVSADDNAGPASDFLTEKSITNDLGILSPYELTFRCFSPELASVLAGFAGSPNGLLVKTINVELAPTPAAPDSISQPAPQITQPVAIPVPPTPTQASRMSEDAAFRSRYGLGPRGGEVRSTQPPPFIPQPVPTVPGVAATPANKGGLPTVLDERQLKVTMLLHVVKLATPSHK